MAADLAILEPAPDRALTETLNASFTLPLVFGIDGQTPDDMAADMADDIDAERRKLAGVMTALGYLQARVDLSGSGTPDDPLRFTPVPGPLFSIRTIRFDGLPLQPDPTVLAATEALADRGTGRIALADVFDNLRRGVVFALKEAAYATASVRRVDTTLDPATQLADIVVTVDPGPRLTFGKVSFRGSFRMNDTQLSALVPFKSGEPYKGTAVSALRKALDQSGTFRRIRIEETVQPETPGMIDLSIRLWDKADADRGKFQSFWLIPTIVVLILIEAVHAVSPSLGKSLRGLSIFLVVMMVGRALLEVGGQLHSMLSQ